MYKIFCDGKLLFIPTDDALSLESPILQVADNSIGNLSFTINPTHYLYQELSPLTTKIEIFDDGERIFAGRVLTVERDLYNNKKVVVESELAYLMDTTQPPNYFEGINIRKFLSNLLEVHNSKVAEDKKFYVGAVTVNVKDGTLRKWTNNETTWQCIQEKLVKSYGGHLRVRIDDGKRYLDYLEDIPQLNEQIIEFGYNLLDYADNFDVTDLCTVVIPVGSTIEMKEGQQSKVLNIDDRVDITSVNNGKRYLVNEEAVKNFGWIERVVTWDDVTDANYLKKQGEKYLKASQFMQMQIVVKALDLNTLNPNIKPIRLLDEVRAISRYHGLDKRFPVLKMTLDLSNRAENIYTLGIGDNVTLSSRTAQVNSQIKEEIEKLPTKNEILDDAKNNATHLLNNALGGYVVKKRDELLIMDTDNESTAKRLWRWNLNGLGYSKNGYRGRYDTAITMDGGIVGERLVVGSVKTEALDANFRTKLKNGEEQLSKLQVKANSIESEVSKKVNNSELGTKIQQNYNAVRIAFNNNSNYLQFESGELRIYNSSLKGSENLVVKFNQFGNWFYRDGYTIGNIGTNRIKDTDNRGLVFDLEKEASFMSWSCKNEDDEYYGMKLAYVQKPIKGNYWFTRADALYALSDFFICKNIYGTQGKYYRKGANCNTKVVLPAEGGGSYTLRVVNGLLCE